MEVHRKERFPAVQGEVMLRFKAIFHFNRIVPKRGVFVCFLGPVV